MLKITSTYIKSGQYLERDEDFMIAHRLVNQGTELQNHNTEQIMASFTPCTMF